MDPASLGAIALRSSAELGGTGGCVLVALFLIVTALAPLLAPTTPSPRLRQRVVADSATRSAPMTSAATS